MTMFPDYPQQPDEHAGNETVSCCEALETPSHLDERAWRVVHQLAHGRVPFTVDTVIAYAGVERRHAEAAIVATAKRGWVTVPNPEPYQHDAPITWMGCLKQLRRGV